MEIGDGVMEQWKGVRTDWLMIMRRRRRCVCVQKIAKDCRQIWGPFPAMSIAFCIALHYNGHAANPATKPAIPKIEAASMSMPLTRGAAAPKPVLGDRGVVKVLLLPSRAGAY